MHFAINEKKTVKLLQCTRTKEHSVTALRWIQYLRFITLSSRWLFSHNSATHPVFRRYSMPPMAFILSASCLNAAAYLLYKPHLQRIFSPCSFRLVLSCKLFHKYLITLTNFQFRLLTCQSSVERGSELLLSSLRPGGVDSPIETQCIFIIALRTVIIRTLYLLAPPQHSDPYQDSGASALFSLRPRSEACARCRRLLLCITEHPQLGDWILFWNTTTTEPAVMPQNSSGMFYWAPASRILL